MRDILVLDGSESSPCDWQEELLLGAPLCVLERRLRSFRRAVNAARTRLARNERTISRLRAELLQLKDSPAMEARREARPFPARGPLAYWICAIVAGAAAALCLFAPRAGAGRRLPPPILSAPAAPVPQAPSAAPFLSDEEAGEHALQLVYEYRIPGSRLKVEEALSPQVRSAEHSHWVIERTGNSACFVTFRPFGATEEAEAPLFEFEVDLASGIVAATAETAESLRRGFKILGPSEAFRSSRPG